MKSRPHGGDKPKIWFPLYLLDIYALRVAKGKLKVSYPKMGESVQRDTKRKNSIKERKNSNSGHNNDSINLHLKFFSGRFLFLSFYFFSFHFSFHVCLSGFFLVGNSFSSHVKYIS